MSRRKLGKWNAVRGYPDWHYGLLVHEDGHKVTFGVYGPNGQTIEGLRASGYRTTKLARFMGVTDMKGYEHVAREAIAKLKASA